jgi:hypothetical protein
LQRFVLPTLSAKETREFVKHITQQYPECGLNEGKWDEYYEQVGGVPRHLFSQTAIDDAKSAQMTAVPDVMFTSPLHEPTETETHKDQKSALIMAIPSENRSRIECFDFVSRNAREVWLKGQKDEDLSDLLNRFRKGPRDTFGRIF